MFVQQVKSILKKNFLVSLRSKEIYIELAIPFIVSIMLVLKSQLGQISQMLPMVYALANCVTIRSVILHMVEEKQKRFKESQKIMGLSQTAYVVSWMLYGYIKVILIDSFFFCSWSILTAMMSIDDWDTEYRVSFADLFRGYLLFSISAVNQGLLITALLSDTKIAQEVITFFQVIMLFFTYALFVIYIAKSPSYYIILSIISPYSNQSFVYVGAMKGTGSPWTHLFPSKLVSIYFSFHESQVLQAVMLFVYLIAYIYADQVVPNEFGVAKHPLFFLDYFKNFSFRSRGEKFNTENNDGGKSLLAGLDQTEGNGIKHFRDHSSAIHHEHIKKSQQNEPTILIQGLTKDFGIFKAVDELTLYLYESQIFCLLGHNGAGKTTTISLLTGLYSKTGGKVTMYGMDLDSQLFDIRKTMGLCQQRDTLYNHLTVMEHLIFMCGIKGVPIKDDKLNHILQITELYQEKEKLVGELSGGSMRKLSLSLSLIGDAQIIFLDEPTSGMDANSRRSIWKILERIKQEKRTIILTTHHLDEAEILADRIGIMSKGLLLAVGSSDFIKRKFGEGYNLKIRLDDRAEEFIEKGINSGKFVLITLQQIIKFAEDSSDGGSTSGGQVQKKVDGSFYQDLLKTKGRIYILSILKRHIPEGSLSEQQSNELLNYLVPFSGQGKLQLLFNELECIEGLSVSMEMNTLEDAFVNIGMEEQKYLIQKEEEEIKRKIMIEQAKNRDSEDEGERLMELVTEPGLQQQQQMQVQQVQQEKQHQSHGKQQQQIQVPECLKRPPVFSYVNQIIAVFLRRYYATLRVKTNYVSLIFCIIVFTMGGWTIQNIDVGFLVRSQMIQEYIQLGLLGCCVMITYCFNSSMIIALPVMEKETKLRYCLEAIGCSRLSYWVGTFLCDLTLFWAQFLLFIVSCYVEGVSSVPRYISEIIFITFCFSFNYLSFIYMASNFFATTEQALQVFAVFNFFVIYFGPYSVLGVLQFIYEQNDSQFNENLMYFFQGIFLCVSPFWTFYQGFALVQNDYKLIKIINNMAPPLLVENYKIYSLVLVLQAVMFVIVLAILENNRSQQPQKKLSSQSIDKLKLNKEVSNEYDRIMSGECNDPIKALMLEKEYHKDKNVLQQPTFGVKEGEIFAIIGPNCAGKSTLVNIQTGLINATSGYSLLYNMNGDNINRLHVGICPQFDCIWDYMTPVEHLQVFGRIKGLKGQELLQANAYFIETMQLDFYVKSYAGNLSGGNKRKLCVADCLIGGSSLLFLDEPSTGVDPVARRFLFQTLKRNIQLRNSSVIITTHTIEEAEVLCDRLGILVQGQFLCLGTPEQLRKQYSSGYTITVKFDLPEREKKFKDQINDKFKLITYLDDKRDLSVTFACTDDNFNFFRTYEYFDHLMNTQLIQDFSINQTSLESIFLYFIKQQSAEKEE